MVHNDFRAIYEASDVLKAILREYANRCRDPKAKHILNGVDVEIEDTIDYKIEQAQKIERLTRG